MTVIYEWDVETVQTYEDGNNDVIDHYHTETYADAVRWAAAAPLELGVTYEVVLVRDDDDRRSWAYVEDGKLPEWCRDAYECRWGKVPKRYHAEVAKL